MGAIESKPQPQAPQATPTATTSTQTPPYEEFNFTNNQMAGLFLKILII